MLQRWLKTNLVIKTGKRFPNAFRFLETHFHTIDIKTYTESDLETLNQWVEGSIPSGVTNAFVNNLFTKAFFLYVDNHIHSGEKVFYSM